MMRVEQIGDATLYLGDFYEEMSDIKNNKFDLAIVDPPYGIKEDGHRENHTRSKLAKSKKYNSALWDQKPPPPEYFDHLKRISKNQIIWGANHLCHLFNAKSPCWIVWNKKCKGGNHFADAEIAYGSFKTAVRTFEFVWQGMIQNNMKEKEERIHPTQKPVSLYDWLLHKYANAGDKIIDTHLGSGSSVIACLNAGYEVTAYEIDEAYFDAACKRIEEAQRQLRLFT